jgi:serine/threonine protein phosphatase PrpC
LTTTSTSEEAIDTPTCPLCGASVGAGDVFCEACGQELPASVSASGVATPIAPVDTQVGESPPRTTCVACGADGTIADDGYCSVCGMKQPAAHDHEEVVLDAAVAITDRGQRHHRNEDAVAVARRADGRLVAVVSDGVSMTVNPDKASAVAVEAAIRVLTASDIQADIDVPDVLLAAHVEARAAVQAVPFMPDAQLGSPSCTFLAAVVTPPGAIDVAALGDCRAYWLDRSSGGDSVLTADDSWAESQIATHEMVAAQAYSDPRSHAITRWLSLDADPAWRPHLSRFEPGEGRLLLCSDGLWNYTVEAGELTAAASGDDMSLIATARRLVQFANEQGGHDNITVVLVELPLSPGDT